MEEQQELPQGWELVKLKQVVARDGVLIDGDWVESKDQDPQGGIRLIQLADVGDGNYRNKSNRFMTLEKATKLNCTFLQEGDVLVARMPDPLGRACVFPGDEKKAVTVVDVCIIRTGSAGVNHRWLMHTLNSSVVRASIAALQSGSTRLRISRKNLETIELPLPPLPEQRRIVEKLEELFSKLDAGVAAVRRTQALLKRYRQSVLHAAVTGELTRAWREAHPAPTETGAALLRRIRAERRAQWEAAQVAKRGGQLTLGAGWKSKYVEPEAVDTAGLPELPEGWVWATAEQLCTFITKGSTPEKSELFEGQGEIPFVKVYNLTKTGKLDFTINPTYVRLKTHNNLLNRSRVFPGDVLINIVGPPLGKGSCVESVESCIFRPWF